MSFVDERIDKLDLKTGSPRDTAGQGRQAVDGDMFAGGDGRHDSMSDGGLGSRTHKELSKMKKTNNTIKQRRALHQRSIYLHTCKQSR